MKPGRSERWLFLSLRVMSLISSFSNKKLPNNPPFIGKSILAKRFAFIK